MDKAARGCHYYRCYVDVGSPLLGGKLSERSIEFSLGLVGTTIFLPKMRMSFGAIKYRTTERQAFKCFEDGACGYGQVKSTLANPAPEELSKALYTGVSRSSQTLRDPWDTSAAAVCHLTAAARFPVYPPIAR